LERRELPAFAIKATFADNIKNDPDAATIEATINRVIAAYESFIADDITVNITFQEGGGLGSSSAVVFFPKYQDYYKALVSRKTSANDTTAIASLPNQANGPVNGVDTITVKAPLARALGLKADTSSDATITLNTASCNLDRTSKQDPAKFDLQAVVAHEIDEVLGFGSALDAS